MAPSVEAAVAHLLTHVQPPGASTSLAPFLLLTLPPSHPPSLSSTLPLSLTLSLSLSLSLSPSLSFSLHLSSSPALSLPLSLPPSLPVSVPEQTCSIYRHICVWACFGAGLLCAPDEEWALV